MKKKKEITPLDIAISGNELCLMITMASRRSKATRRSVLAELIQGEYYPTSNGLFVRDKKIILPDGGEKTLERQVKYSCRKTSFPEAINKLLELYGEDSGLAYRKLRFPKSERLTRWIFEGDAQVVFYPFPMEDQKEGLLCNGRYVGTATHGKRYSLTGERSAGFIGALIRLKEDVQEKAIPFL